MTSKELEPQAYPEKGPGPLEDGAYDLPPLEDSTKGRWERSWPTIACGAGLFSDGYLNGVSPRNTLRICLLLGHWSHVPCYFVRKTWELTSIISGHWPSQHNSEYHLSGCLRQLYG